MTNGVIYVGVCGLTNDTTCEILSCGSLSVGDWRSEGWLIGTNEDCTLAPLSIGNRTNSLFLTARTPAPSSGTLPLDWQWKYFGQTGVDPNGDYDSDGVSNLAEYLLGTDPNQVTFTVRLGYGRFNSTQATAQFEIVSGMPSYYAVLVNSTNWSDAIWNIYDGSASFALGPTDGVYQVMFGLKGRAPDSQATWRGTAVVLDRQPPALMLTDPTLATVTKPHVQVQGYATEPLLSVSASLSNAAGLQTNLVCLLTGPAAPPTNNFHVFDVPLTNGVNLITITATDLAGNVSSTSVTRTLDYSGQTSGPTIGVDWPQDGAKVASDSFTLRGWVDDETALVTAQIVGNDGTTNLVDGLVERDGRLWIEDLPLTGGTNYLAITASNAAGYSSVTALALVRSDVTVAIDEVLQSDLDQPTTTVTGAVSDDNYKVWVNGVGVLPVNGVWMARNVPVTEGGTAVFAVTLIPLSDNGGDGSLGEGEGESGAGALKASSASTVAVASTSTQSPGDPVGLNPTSPDQSSSGSAPEKGAQVRLVWGQWSQYGSGGNADWGRISGRSSSAFSEGAGIFAEGVELDGPCAGASRLWGYLYTKHPHGQPSGTRWQVDSFSDAAVTASTNEVDVSGWYIDQPWARGSLSGLYYEDPIFFGDAGLSAEVRVVLRTGGKSGVRRMNLFSCSGWAREVYQNQQGGFVERPYNVPPESVFVPGIGKNLGSDGLAYGVLPDNQEVDITPLAPPAYYRFDIGASKYRSHLEVFVRQPYPLYPRDLRWGWYDPDGPPLGYPVYQIGGKQAGHAWWKLSTAAPRNAVDKFAPADISRWLDQEVGYGPIDASLISLFPPVKEGPGTNYTANGSADVHRVYAIGFQGPGLIDGLSHTETVHANPGVWNSATHNCVHEVVVTGSAAGISLPIGDGTPESFGFDIPVGEP